MALYNSKKSGFSLIELSIVLVIIGLMIGAIIGGRALVQQAELQKITREINTIRTAINTFRTQYNFLPGDFPEASQYWGGFDWTGNGALDGNGNSFFDGVEGAMLWQHLAKAEIIPGTYWGDYSCHAYCPVPNVNGAYPGFNIYASTLKGAGYSIAQDVYGIYNGGAPEGKNYMELAVLPGDDFYGNGVLIARDARSIDLKMDDGIAGKGFITATPNRVTLGCTTGGIGASPSANNYVLSDTQVKCMLVYWGLENGGGVK